jgi:hypothetical protein
MGMSNVELCRHIEHEIETARALACKARLNDAFERLERAHVLGQADTTAHTRVHWLMLKIALRKRDVREIWGQMIRIIGAATKTPLGIYPTGNTGGSNVWFFKPMPIPEDLRAILQRARLVK